MTDNQSQWPAQYPKYGPPEGTPAPSDDYKTQPAGYPVPSSGYPAPPAGYPVPQGGYPVPPGGYQVQPGGGYPVQQAGYQVRAQASMRASSADRERAVDVLKAGFAEGRLTQDEYNDRMGRAYAARTYGELAALTADLPAAGAAAAARPRAADLLEFDQWGGNVSRTGRWVTPARIQVRVVGGNVKLDFTEAQISSPTLPIEADLEGGNLILVIKPGIAVEANHLAMVGGNVRYGKGTDQRVPDVLQVQLSGRLLGGSVVVRLPRRTFWEWLTRKPRPYSATA